MGNLFVPRLWLFRARADAFVATRFVEHCCLHAGGPDDNTEVSCVYAPCRLFCTSRFYHGGARAEMHMHTAAYIGKAAPQTIERDDNQFLDAAAQA